MLKTLLIGLSAFVFVACTSSSSVPLQGPATAPTNPGESGGEAKPTPAPSATPKPGEPTPTPAPTPAPVANLYPRIYCTTVGVSAQSISSMPGSASEDFIPSSIDFLLEDGTKANYIKFPVALKSDLRDGTAILKAGFENSSDPQKIYKAKIDFVTGHAVIKLLSSYSNEPNGYPYIPQNLGLPLSVLAANDSKTAIVYPNDRGNYILESLTSGTKSLTSISAEFHANPRFIRDAWLVFDQQVSNYKVTQKFYSVKSGKTSSLSPSEDYQLAGYVSTNGTKFWIEGRPRSGWKLKTDGSSKSSTIMMLPGSGNDILIPAVFFEKDGKVHLAYLEEKIIPDQKGILYVKTGVLHILEISSSLKVSESKTVEYSDRIKQLIARPRTSTMELLRGLMYEPIEGKVYASNFSAGGLVSYNLDKKSWGIHATREYCYYPSMGIEESYE